MKSMMFGLVFVLVWLSQPIAGADKKPSIIHWKFNAPSWPKLTNPVIGADGTVYITSMAKHDNKVYALDGKTGEKKWKFETRWEVLHTPPAIAADGTVYVGTMDTEFYALDGKTGAKKWEFRDALRRVLPAIGADGSVYVGASRGRKVYALNGKNGAKKWTFETKTLVEAPPTIGSDGTVYVGAYEVYALDGKTGAKKWEFTPVGGYPIRPPIIEANGTVYFMSGYKLYALKGKTGTKKWEYGPREYGKTVPTSSPAIGVDGTVYIGSADKKFYAFDGATGAKKWEFVTEGYVTFSPTIGSDGTVYVGSDGEWITRHRSTDKKVYALDGKTGAKKWEFVTGQGSEISRGSLLSNDKWKCPPVAIGADGTVYVGSIDAKVYALDGKTGVKKWLFFTGDGEVFSPFIGADGTVYISRRGLYAVNGKLVRAVTEKLAPEMSDHLTKFYIEKPHVDKFGITPAEQEAEMLRLYAEIEVQTRQMQQQRRDIWEAGLRTWELHAQWAKKLERERVNRNLTFQFQANQRKVQESLRAQANKGGWKMDGDILRQTLPNSGAVDPNKGGWKWDGDILRQTLPNSGTFDPNKGGLKWDGNILRQTLSNSKVFDPNSIGWKMDGDILRQTLPNSGAFDPNKGGLKWDGNILRQTLPNSGAFDPNNSGWKWDGNRFKKRP